MWTGPQVFGEEISVLAHAIARALGGTGYVKTDFTGGNGFMTAEEGAKLPVEYALLGDGPVSGRFVEPAGNAPW